MMRDALHIGSLVVAVAAACAFILLGAAAQHHLAPNRPLGDRLTTLLTPNRSARDFVGSGWRYWKLRWLAMLLFLVAIFLFGLTGTHR